MWNDYWNVERPAKKDTAMGLALDSPLGSGFVWWNGKQLAQPFLEI